jgi:glycosyltransferase involved in cell wall biosynthesis
VVKVFQNTALRQRLPGARSPVALSMAFYNNPKVLDLTLASLKRQSFQDFEIILCDDGSRPQVIEHIQRELEKLSIPAQHLWHEDLGFRKNRILNWGIHHCDSPYMIFIDQDCLAHPEFVREHFENRQIDRVLCGRRMDLNPWISKLLTAEKVQRGFIEKNLWWIILAGLYMKDNNGGKGLYLRSPFLRAWANRKQRSIVGCNFSIHREVLFVFCYLSMSQCAKSNPSPNSQSRPYHNVIQWPARLRPNLLFRTAMRLVQALKYVHC